METVDQTSRLDRRSSKRVGLLVAALLLLVSSLAWLFGQVEHELAGEELHEGRTVAFAYLPGSVGFWVGEPRLEVFEGGRRLGPRVEDRHEVRAVGAGAYALETRRWSTSSILRFTASDGSSPRSNGRRYIVRYPRWQLPASLVLVSVVWLAFGMVAVGHRIPDAGGPMRASAWCVVIAGAMYSLFVAQAWLVPPNGSWLLAVGALALPPAFARPVWTPRAPSAWFVWLAGLLLWMGITCIGGSSYASRGKWLVVCLTTAWGLVLLLGFRQRLAERDRSGTGPLLALFVLVVGLSLARNAGFELDRTLTVLGLSQAWSGKILNPWTTKFLAHWTLIVTWCAVAAMGLGSERPRRFGAVASAMIALAAVAVVLAGSKTAVVALLCSGTVAGFAYFWPRWTRRLVLVGVVVSLLTAPLLAALPWRMAAASPGALSGEAGDAFELAARGSIWEFGRRLVALRPLEGWGIGSTASLPGRELSVAEVLGPAAASAAPSLSERAVMPGGHPHSAALLIWLDLGLVGALLVAGLAVSIGREIAVVEGRRTVHGALLALVTVTWVVVFFNYPLWQPEVLSILWMTAALPAALLGRREVRPSELVRNGSLVVLVLLLGCSVVAQGRLSRYSIARACAHGEVSLDSGSNVLVTGEGERELDDGGRLRAGAKLLESGAGGAISIRGWAYDPIEREAPEAVLVFVGAELVGVAWPGRPSPELFLETTDRDVQALFAGFRLGPVGDRFDLENPVTIVSLRGGDVLGKKLPALSTPELGAGQPPQDGDKGPGAT